MRIKMLGMVVAALTVAQVASAQTQQEITTWDTTWAQYKAFEQIPFPQRGTVKTSVDFVTDINSNNIKNVFDIYSNVYNALGVHPFLTSITHIRHTRDRFDFIAYENIPLPDGTIFPGVTVTQQRFNRPHSYEVETWDNPGIITRQTISFAKVGPRTIRVTEHLEFEAPLIFIDLAAQGGVYAHQIVAQSLKAKIESRQLRAVKFPKYLPDDGDDDDDCDD